MASLHQPDRNRVPPKLQSDDTIRVFPEQTPRPIRGFLPSSLSFLAAFGHLLELSITYPLVDCQLDAISREDDGERSQEFHLGKPSTDAGAEAVAEGNEGALDGLEQQRRGILAGRTTQIFVVIRNVDRVIGCLAVGKPALGSEPKHIGNPILYLLAFGRGPVLRVGVDSSAQRNVRATGHGVPPAAHCELLRAAGSGGLGDVVDGRDDAKRLVHDGSRHSVEQLRDEFVVLPVLGGSPLDDLVDFLLQSLLRRPVHR